ncbi:MAG: hydantoinase/oxoprolinase family protein [Alphaproteobacteria bacterium]|nr:hydantoinase/oxoprolinase family protein [Alphaproteobacteria bacterium]
MSGASAKPATQPATQPAAGRAGVIVGVDVGGTYTDVFALDEATGRVRVAKVPTSRPDQSAGLLAGLAAATDGAAEVASLVHGSTVGTNALLERKGARTGVITTQGFRDVLEMRRRDRPQTWGLWGGFEPVAPRDLRLEVAERTLADGTILEPVDLAEVEAAARTLLERGAEACAIVFINAYANPANERAALDVVRRIWPNAYVEISSAVLPEIREFERASTTAINAYLQPVVSRYIATLESGLGAGGFAGELMIVQSNGGVMSAETARLRPVRTALSGPAAGVIAAAHIAVAAGHPNVITGDVGGTSFDVSLIASGRAALSAQTSIGFGMVVRSPMIEITTIGAGGGSIARIDRGGLLQIGPESAGSDPGPACYGGGSPHATVTDANVLLGRINAERPIGGKLARLDRDAAARAIETHVGKPLGLDLLAAAEAMLRVANSNMAGAIRLVSIERGHDPARFALMPFGGGGPLHAGALIRDVGLARALVPRFPGITSALGCTIADMRHDFVQTFNALLDEIALDRVMAESARAHAAGAALIARAGVLMEGIETRIEFDMSYVGQTHTVAVPVPSGTDATPGARLTRALVRDCFEATYRAAYGQLLDRIPVRILNLRTAVIGRRPKFDLSLLAPASGLTLDAARTGSRPVHAEGRWHEAVVYNRLALPAGTAIRGPAVLEQPDATIWIDPDMQASVDRLGNVLIERAQT